MSILNPFQLLELNVISAQDLAPVSRAMRTYAVAWVHPDRKLSTRVDTQGHANPTWNDKFVFRVDDDFLHSDTSAVMIEIYALHWFKDVHVGTVRILVGNLIPGARTSSYGKDIGGNLGMRFVALQVRRQSGRPQGILNIGVAVLHSAMRSMPIYSQLSTSAVGYRELMGEDDPTPRSGAGVPGERRLRRSKSDTSSMIGSEIRAKAFREEKTKDDDGSGQRRRRRRKGRSKGSSAVSLSTVGTGKKLPEAASVSAVSSYKAKVVNNGDDYSDIGAVYVDPEPELPDPPAKKGKSGKWRRAVSSLLNGYSEVGSYNNEEGNLAYFPPKKAVVAVKPSPRFNVTSAATPRRKVLQTPGKSPYIKFAAPYEYGTPRKTPAMGRGTVYLTESELGPSASEVAAAIAKKPAVAVEESESSVLGGWSVDESVEGLRSKLDRWRTELPPVYDRGELSSFTSTEPRHVRRHTDGGAGDSVGGDGAGAAAAGSGGLFSCFSNICGVECSIVCGGGGGGSVASKKGGGMSERIVRSPSADTLNYN